MLEAWAAALGEGSGVGEGSGAGLGAAIADVRALFAGFLNGFGAGCDSKLARGGTGVGGWVSGWGRLAVVVGCTSSGCHTRAQTLTCRTLQLRRKGAASIPSAE